MEFINNGFNGDAGTNEHHEINGKEKTSIYNNIS
jgi:hypothetical protein